MNELCDVSCQQIRMRWKELRERTFLETRICLTRDIAL